MSAEFIRWGGGGGCVLETSSGQLALAGISIEFLIIAIFCATVANYCIKSKLANFAHFASWMIGSISFEIFV